MKKHEKSVLTTRQPHKKFWNVMNDIGKGNKSLKSRKMEKAKKIEKR